MSYTVLNGRLVKVRRNRWSAGRIMDGKPEHYDAIEVQGVRSYSMGPNNVAYEVDNANPESYSVYLRLKDGGVDCVGDMTLRKDAQEYAADLSAAHGWPIHDFTQDEREPGA